MAGKRTLSERKRRVAEVSAPLTDIQLARRFKGTIAFPDPGTSNEISLLRGRIRAALLFEAAKKKGRK